MSFTSSQSLLKLMAIELMMPFSHLILCCPKDSIQLLSHVWLFAAPWIAARQASLSFTISQSLLKLMAIESVIQCQWCQWLNDTESLAVLSLIDILQEIFKQHYMLPVFFDYY